MAERADMRALAPLITFVSASGGVGKSTLALMSAWLTAEAGLRCALLEADLQFGDMGYWVGADASVAGLESAPECAPAELVPGLDFYRAPAFPECAEEVSEQVAAFMPLVRTGRDVVFADTGQFWSGLTGELVCASDLVMIVFDCRQTSVMGAVRAQELLARMGVATSRCVCVYNRWSSRARLGKQDVSDALACRSLCCIPDGKDQVEMHICAGDISELIEACNPMVNGVEEMLESSLSRVGCPFEARPLKRKRGIFR